MGRIYVGTSSWSDFSEWYPSGLPKNQQISYYAERFAAVKLNSTFYRIMPRRNYELWVERTPPGFFFDVKPFRLLTFHDRKKPPDEATTLDFGLSLEPLRAAGKLGALHFQFPPWFASTADNLNYVVGLRQAFSEDKISVEFRHRSWLETDHIPGLTRELTRAQIALTVVDEPQVGNGCIPTVPVVTDPRLAIVRFHGRNTKMWYARVKRAAMRFDYRYSPEELREWAPRLVDLADQVEALHVFFNNNAHSYAVQNAAEMNELMRELVPSDLVLPQAGDKSGTLWDE